VEGTSGNTGMGLAIAAVVKGYKCIFATTDKQSKEKVDMLKAVGAEVIVCPTNVEPSDPRSYYSVSARLATEIPNAWYVNQYDNLSNSAAHYESTGPEIWEQTEGKITHLVVGVGTGGTISGTGRYLKEKNPNIKIWGIDTYGSVLKKYKDTGILDENEIYPYITEGIGEDFLPKNIDFEIIDHFEKVTDKDGLIMTRKIAKEEGILVGNSAGSAIAGLLQMKAELKKSDVVVVIFHDHASRYMGKPFNDDWMRERGFLEEDSITAKSIIEQKNMRDFVSIDKNESIQTAIKLMKEFDISQIPVSENGQIIGSVNESDVLSKIIENPYNINKTIDDIVGKPFPTIDINTSVEKISTYITKKNTAVLVKDAIGQTHIITEYDLIRAIAK
jgi:cystathionine beta-synthase